MSDRIYSAEFQHALRLIDANANRAVEGLRTIEDYARLVGEDALAAEWLKALRHQLAKALAGIDRQQRLAVRSTETDAGTGITTAAEGERATLADVVRAASERATQAIRCLEEYSKFVSDDASQAFKQLRYDAYDVLAKVELRLFAPNPVAGAQLYLLVDCRQPLEQFVRYVSDLADAGVDLFQLRDKQADGAELMQYARAAVNALQATPAKLIVNDRLDIALASGAAGVHLGQEDMLLADARRMAGNRLWIGISTHDLEQVVAAEQAGADYIGCGPTFPSSTKRFGEFPGSGFLRAALSHCSLPVFAIGGIDHANLQEVLDAGCRQIAVSGAINAAAEPAVAARALKQALQRRLETVSAE